MKTRIVISAMFLILAVASGINAAKARFQAMVSIAGEYFPSSTATGLTGFSRHGQVFLTWNNASNSNNHYKVYRSVNAIIHGSQLSQCEYLGYVTQLSAKDYDLSIHYGSVYYFKIDSGRNSLLPNKGLLVATTLADGNYFYAVTVSLNGVEDTTIITGANALTSSIAEQVSAPQPVFQNIIQIHGKDIELYTNFFSFKTEISAPPILSAGFIASDFLLYRNNSTGNQPFRIQMHGGGEDFFYNIDVVTSNEMNLNFESNFPNGADGSGWGANSNYDIYNEATSVPASGINYNFLQQLYQRTIDWAIKNLSIDSNRIYITGSSAGACAAFAFAITYPDKLAGIQLGVPCFNLAFENDSVPHSSLNIGMPNRKKADTLLGLVSSNLPSNLGERTFDALNGGWKVHHDGDKDLPIIYAISGKNDVLVGWTEKTIYYDSVNTNAPGGYYFWDSRAHGGTGAFWGDHNFDLFRFRRNVSYPAFSNCSLNENFGNGAPTSGASYGTVNGALDWVDPIADSFRKWELTFFIRDLKTAKGQTVHYPDSATLDITPRRLQQFHIPSNAMVHWSVSHHSQIVQSDSGIYHGGAITIRDVKVFKDSARFRLWFNAADSLYVDADEDGYTPAQGDCNDHNPIIHPGASDFCNGIDDNCNGTTDENAIVATVSPDGNVSVCKNAAFILTANGGAGISYQWLKNGSPISGATSQAYSPTQTALYSVSENNLFDCSSTSAATSVALLNLPSVTITPLGDLDICLTGFVNLQANSGIHLTYQWKKGSNNIAGATSQVYTAATIGNYRVTVTNNNNCSRTSSAVAVTKSCRENLLEEANDRETLNIYPNPTNGKFNIAVHLNTELNSPITLQVINQVGQVIYSEILLMENGKLQTEIQLNTEAGFYLVKVNFNDQLLEEPLVITK